MSCTYVIEALVEVAPGVIVPAVVTVSTASAATVAHAAAAAATALQSARRCVRRRGAGPGTGRRRVAPTAHVAGARR